VTKPDGSSNPFAPKFDPEDTTQSTLIFPVFFLYPQYATSDVIEQFYEDTTFTAHLENMFPPNASRPAWDEKGEYVVGKMSVYAMTRGRRLLKIGKKMTLKDVFKATTDVIEVKDGCLTFSVLPKGAEEEKWIAAYKAGN
jgi:small subunit ribosomal protein S7e